MTVGSGSNYQDFDEGTLTDAAAWLSRLTGGDASDAEWDEFTGWLYADPRHGAAMHLVESGWRASAELADDPAILAERRRARGLRLAGPATKPLAAPRQPWSMALMGAGALALAALAVVSIFPPANYSTRQTYRSAMGQVMEVPLPDGSLMRLNTDTMLTVEYGWLGRDVRLERGEAEFTVAHGDFRPFTVRDGDTAIRATGTLFSVRDMEGGTRVFLAEGGVDLRRQSDDRLLTQLTPGQRADVATDGKFVLSSSDAAREFAWRHGQVAFEATPLPAALAEFARYTHVEVEVMPGAAGLKVSGVYRNSDLIAFLNAVSRLYKVRWHQTSPGRLVVEPVG
jgi:transmembrane sensor